MRTYFAVAALILQMSMPARADPPKLALFDFELLDTSLDPVAGVRALTIPLPTSICLARRNGKWLSA